MKYNQESKNSSLEYFLSIKYPISIYPEDEGGYTALISDLPEFITQGKTLEEVFININENKRIINRNGL